MIFSVIIPSYGDINNLDNIINYLIEFKYNKEFYLNNIYIIYCCGLNPKILSIIFKYNFVKLIIEKERNGKAHAINLALEKDNSDIIVVHSADCLTNYKSIKNILTKFKEDSVGGVIPISHPLISKNSLVEKISATSCLLLNETIKKLDFEDSLLTLGNDIYAFRRECLNIIPENIVNEDAFIAIVLKSRGYKIKLANEAITYINTTKKLSEYLKQRERINYGHELNYRISKVRTSSFRWILIYKPFKAMKIIKEFIKNYKELSFYLFLLVYIEMVSIIIYKINLFSKKDYIRWSIAYSTKNQIKLIETY